MKHSFSTSNFYLKENPEKMLRWAKKHNFGGMEIWADVPHFYVDNVDKKLLEKYSSQGSQISYSVHTPIYGTSIGAVNPGILRESLRQVEKIIDWAEFMPYSALVLHAGTTPSAAAEVKEIVREILYRSMERLKEKARRRGVELVIENIGISERYWDREVKSLTTLMDNFDMGLCLDIGHLNLSPEPEEKFRALRKYVKHIHISDNNGKDDDHFPVGEGLIDYNIYKDMLLEFEGLVVHEIHAPRDPAAATLRSRENLDKILGKNVSRETNKGPEN
jgi:sugar phosphate isomerase/epimerase